MLAHKHKVFCDEFIKTYDYNNSCAEAKVNKNSMLAHLYDKQSDVSKYLQQQVDIFALSNTYITEEFVKYRLGLIMVQGRPQHKIAAAKILLGYKDAVDKTEEFLNLVKAIRT